MISKITLSMAAASSNPAARVLVVLSGGQDSATCLALANFTRTAPHLVHTIAFDYGQKHRVELECAARLAMHYGCTHRVVKVEALGEVGVSALTGSLASVSGAHPHLPGRPASFVPHRNATFLTLAHAYAITLGVDEIWTGVCETDYSGYPDCRREFINSLEDTLALSAEKFIPIVTPLMQLNKAETWELADRCGAVDIIRHQTHTCYNGKHDHAHRHEWGYGCGECPACQLRAKGYEEFQNAKS